MSADLNMRFRALIALAGGNTGFDLARTLASLGPTSVYENEITLPEGQLVAAVSTLWTGTGHGTSGVSTSLFALAAVIVDPDLNNASSIPIDIQVYSTIVGSGTTKNWTHRVTREVPLIIGSPLAATHQVTATDALTNVAGATPEVISRIDARNPNAAIGDSSNDVKVRLLVIK